MPDSRPDLLLPPAAFCPECGLRSSARWKFCAGCGRSLFTTAPDLDALLRATAAAKAARPNRPGAGERTVSFNVTLLGITPAAFQAEQAYLRGSEVARAFGRLPPSARPRKADPPPALIVSAFALMTALAVFLLFYFVQHF